MKHNKLGRFGKIGKIGRGRLLMLCLLLTALLLVSCGKSGSEAANDNAMVEHKLEVDTSASASGSNAPGEEYYTNGSLDGSEDKEDSAGQSEYEVKIIRTATMSAQTKEFDTAVSEIESTVAALGGYIESSEVRGTDYVTQKTSVTNRYATFTLRIPAERLDEFLTTTGELVNVTNSSTTATDVSSEYYDIEARLSVLETERAVLEEMLSEATSMDNMIKVEERLYDVIYEIESYKTMLKVYDSKVAYSTVTLSLSEVTDLTVIPTDNSFGARFKKAVSESWQNAVDFCKDTVINLVYALPALVVLAVFLVALPLAVLLIVRGRVRKNRRARQMAEAVTEAVEENGENEKE